MWHVLQWFVQNHSIFVQSNSFNFMCEYSSKVALRFHHFAAIFVCLHISFQFCWKIVIWANRRDNRFNSSNKALIQYNMPSNIYKKNISPCILIRGPQALLGQRLRLYMCTKNKECERECINCIDHSIWIMTKWNYTKHYLNWNPQVMLGPACLLSKFFVLKKMQFQR